MKLLRLFLPLGLLLAIYLPAMGQQVHPHYVDGELYWRVSAQAQPFLPDSILQAYQIREMACPFLPLNPTKLAGREKIEVLHRTYRIRFNEHGLTQDLRAYLLNLPMTELVEGVPLTQTFYTPNDPQLASQWNLSLIDAAGAWNLSFGNAAVRVAVVDDAVLTTHQDLAPSIWVNPNEIAGNNLDDDGNGYIDDVSGWDAADGDNNPNPPIGSASSSVYTHGTHCAGIVGAATDNGVGIASIGFGIKLIPVKCNNDATPGPTLPASYDGLTYAITLVPEVISLSWGGPGSSSTNQVLLDVAYANDIVVVAAAGNSNVNTPMYPASYNHVISVAATDPSDLKAGFSNYGATIDVSAPGVNILSTLAGSNSDYGQLSGTSMACPLVAGLCGLMRSFNPAKTVDEIETCLKTTADPLDALNPGYTGQLGAGRIHAFRALQCVSGPPIALFTSNNTNVCPGSTVQFTDQSYGTPTSWAWTFPGGVPASSTLQNPSVTYSTAGTYPVTLTVTNGVGTDTYTFNNIVVAIPTATMSGGGLINVGSPAMINVNFTGSPPFSFTYTNGSTNFTVNGINSSSYSFTVTPTVSTTYSLVSMNNTQCTGTVSGNALVVVSTGCAALVTFQKIMGGTHMDNPQVAKQAPDCGYILGGSTYSYGTGFDDAVLSKLDQNGNLVWFKTYGNATDNTYFYDVIPVGNGYVCLGNRAANNQSRMFIMKTDFNGVFQWQQNIQWTSGGGAVFTTPTEVVEMANGDLAVASTASHSNFNSSGQTIMRLNGTTGAIIWARNAQINNFEGASGIVRTPGGNIVTAGHSRSVGAGLFEFAVTERDGTGNLVWSRNYGGNANEYGEDLVRLPDGGYLVVGYTQSFASSVSDIMILRISSTGGVVWSRKYARAAADVALHIVEGCNGKYFVAGSSRTPNNGNDALLFQIDLNGNVIWAQAIGGVLDDGNTIGLGRSGDCGCILTASTLSFGMGDHDYLVVKTDSAGFMDCHSTPVTLTVQAITPTVTVAGLTNGTNSPAVATYTTTEMSHVPTEPDDVCDACGIPIANFDFVTNVLSLACLDNSVNGQVWSWNFGDGSPLDTMRNAVHVFAGPGTYQVTLIVSSACGSDTLSKSVTITGLNECKHVLQPGPVNGVDADILSRDDATNNNSGNSGYLYIATWTWSGNPGTGRSYVWYDLSRICNTANLLDARLSVNYHNLIGQVHQGANAGWLSRCTTPWDEYAVTWLNQPTVTATNRINVPALAGAVNLTNLNVTPLFQDLIIGPNFGFQWRHQTEATYRCTIFLSSDWPNPAERPRLELRFDPIFAHAEVPSTGTKSVTICEGDSVQLSLAGYLNGSTTTGPSVATEYLWVPSEGLSCSTCPNPMASPDSTITYKAVAYNCPSCADIDTIRVVVSKVKVEAPDQILCAGDSVQMSAIHPIANTNFIWTPTTTLAPANVQYPWAYPTVPTWYYVTATDNVNGCVSTDSAYVLTGYEPFLPTLIDDTVICQGTGTVTFPLNPNFTPIGSDFYEWNLVSNITPDPNSPSSDAIIDISLSPATYHYILSATNSFGCVNRDSVLVTVGCIILPAAPVNLVGSALAEGNLLEWRTLEGQAFDRFVLERSADGGTFEALTAVAARGSSSEEGYVYLDGQPLVGDNFYRLQAWDLDGEASYSETVLISKDLGTVLTLHPNPTKGDVVLSSERALVNAQFRVLNLAGQVVMELKGLQGRSFELDLTGQAKGAYVLEIREGGEVSRLRVVVQ